MRLLFNRGFNMYPNLLKSLTWRCCKLKIFLNAGSLLAAHQCLKDGHVFISNVVFCVGALWFRYPFYFRICRLQTFSASQHDVTLRSQNLSSEALLNSIPWRPLHSKFMSLFPNFTVLNNLQSLTKSVMNFQISYPQNTYTTDLVQLCPLHSPLNGHCCPVRVRNDRADPGCSNVG